MNAVSVVGVFLFPDDKGLRITLALAGLLASIAVLLALAYRSTPPVRVAVDAELVCLKRREVSFRDISKATVMLSGLAKKRSILLVLGTQGRLSGIVMLRDHRNIPVDEEARAALLAVLHGSSITIPVSPDDPRGKLNHVNFPGSLTKDDAITLVEANPRIDQAISGLSRWQ
jgi:hypothetical protein